MLAGMITPVTFSRSFSFCLFLLLCCTEYVRPCKRMRVLRWTMHCSSAQPLTGLSR